MSQSHIKTQPQPPRPIACWQIVLSLCCVLVLLISAYLISNLIHSYPVPYEKTTGTILEIRKVVDGTLDSRYGGKILYKFEAHVRYLEDGRQQDRWLRISAVTTEALLLKRAAQPTHCIVYWPPDQPENAKCSLQ